MYRGELKMKDILEDINDFITSPQDEDGEKVGGFTVISYLFGALGWLLAYFLVYQYPVWIAFVSWGLSVCFGIVWYNISDDYDTRSKITHYAYAIIAIILNGSWLIAFPLMVVFAVITMPLWIGSLIKR